MTYHRANLKTRCTRQLWHCVWHCAGFAAGAFVFASLATAYSPAANAAQASSSASTQPSGTSAPGHVVVEVVPDEGASVDVLENADLEPLIVLSDQQLLELVGPIALYPDDLLGIVLPAATWPLQIVQAARYLENLKSDAAAQPGANWDDTVVALLNYPVVLAQLNADLDWTNALGQAVLNQQPDVLRAVGEFRNQAYAAGHLRSDDKQVVHNNDSNITITPADPQVVYVPYYQPEHVVTIRHEPAYFYHRHGYPLYYYPYPSGYRFSSGRFWGVSSAYSWSWDTGYLHLYGLRHQRHPYYGYRYHNSFYTRYRPTLSYHNHRTHQRRQRVRRHQGHGEQQQRERRQRRHAQRDTGRQQHAGAGRYHGRNDRAQQRVRGRGSYNSGSRNSGSRNGSSRNAGQAANATRTEHARALARAQRAAARRQAAAGNAQRQRHAQRNNRRANNPRAAAAQTRARTQRHSRPNHAGARTHRTQPQNPRNQRAARRNHQPRQGARPNVARTRPAPRAAAPRQARPAQSPARAAAGREARAERASNRRASHTTRESR